MCHKAAIPAIPAIPVTLEKLRQIQDLKGHFKPKEQFNFPKKFLQGGNRNCKVEYLRDTFVSSKSLQISPSRVTAPIFPCF